MLRLRGPASLKLSTLLVKRKTLQVDLPLDYVAFDVLEDRHAIGHDMGRTGRERGLLYISYVQP